MAAWWDDFEASGAALKAAGWRYTPSENDVVGTRYQFGTSEVEITFLVADNFGRVVIPLAEGPIVWATGPLGDERSYLVSAREDSPDPSQGR